MKKIYYELWMHTYGNNKQAVLAVEYSAGSLTCLIYLNRSLQRDIANTIELWKGTHVATWKNSCKGVLQNKFCSFLKRVMLLLATVMFLLKLIRIRNININLNFFFIYFFLFDYIISEPNLQIKVNKTKSHLSLTIIFLLLTPQLALVVATKVVLAKLLWQQNHAGSFARNFFQIDAIITGSFAQISFQTDLII